MPDIHVYYWDHWIVPGSRIAVRLLVLALLLLPSFVFERRYFRRHQKVRSWVLLHALVPLLATLAVLPTVIVASQVEGMEALGVFYVLLFSLTPVLYFVLHGIVGRLLRPNLGLRDSLLIAATSLALLLGLYLVVALSDGEFEEARYRARARARDRAQEQTGPLRPVKTKLFELPDGSRLAQVRIESTHAFDLDRVDLLVGGRRLKGMSSAASSYVCRRDGAYFLSFVAEPDEAPELSYYWYSSLYPPMFESRVSPKLPGGGAERMAFGQDARGIVSPLPLPRHAVRFEVPGSPGLRWRDYLSFVPVMPSHPMACLPDLLEVPGEVTSLKLVLSRKGGPDDRVEHVFPLQPDADAPSP